MKTISNTQDLQFPDCSVLHMVVNHDLKRAEIEMSGAWSEALLPRGILILRDWHTWQQRRFDLATKSFIDVSHRQEEKLKDIPEFLKEGGKTILRGFGSTNGEWIEIVAMVAICEYHYLS
jgi:hypothetical protein